MRTSDFTVTDLTQYPTSRSAAGYVGFVSQLTRGIDPIDPLIPSSAVLAQHYADSVQRMCLLLRGGFVVANVTLYWPITLPLLHEYCTHTESLLNNT